MPDKILAGLITMLSKHGTYCAIAFNVHDCSRLFFKEKICIRPVVKKIHKAGMGIHNAGSVWYSVGAKTFRDLTLTAADDEDVTVEKSCDICSCLYAITIKAWKIRSCNCAAAPCPKCSAFQIIDLDRLRKERYGAC
jgi:hypothetical protein